MKIFISWSKEKSTSHTVASALHQWLPEVIQGVTPWMSTHDIQSGELWGEVVNKQLEDNSYGILSITPQSMHSPWLLFETGALAKFVDKSRVCPYLSNMTATGLTGPLAQFQSRVSNKDGTSKLVLDINTHLENPIDEDRLQRSFERCWPELDKQLKKAHEQDSDIASKPERRDRELLEELLTLARRIDHGTRPRASDDLFRSLGIHPRELIISPESVREVTKSDNGEVVKYVVPAVYEALESDE